MADTTISQLGTGTPTTGIVIPWSDGTTTYQAKLSSLITASGDMGTGAFKVPVGTTAQRPATTSVGMIRYNTTSYSLEFYDGTNWINVVSSFISEVLIVAGGGGGGWCFGGGGGGGGVIYIPNYAITSKNTINIVVGAGGATSGTSTGYNKGQNGGNSSFGQLVAIGGGGGGGGCYNNGSSGGSGGGGGGDSAGGWSGGSGSTGQGNSGASNASQGGGGGGGAGAAAVNLSRQGASGALYSITGIQKYYGGGGSGSGSTSLAGGLGGGGIGGIALAPGIGDGTVNTGGGGGGSIASGGSTQSGGVGGSGIVIVKYLGQQRASGGNSIYQITVDGLIYTVHEFINTGTSTFTPN